MDRPSLDPENLLSELDTLYKRFREVEHVAVWGGSYEREHGAQMELKPLVNKLFDTCLKFLQLRSDIKSRGMNGKQ